MEFEDYKLSVDSNNRAQNEKRQRCYELLISSNEEV